MRILAPPPEGITLAFVQDKLKGMGASLLFTDTIAPALWFSATKYAIHPCGMIAQSYKETDAGRFTGQVKKEFCNPAGIKIRYPNLFPGITDGDQPLAHAMFPGWEVGAEAHAQHLRIYAGTSLNGHLVVNPRGVFVVGKYRLELFENFGSGAWAPSPSYGREVVAIANRLL
jgi:hypothetical protein